MIVYAAATDQSIARLFIAGVIPGIMLAGLFMGYIIVWALLNKDKMPPPDPATSLRQPHRRDAPADPGGAADRSASSARSMAGSPRRPKRPWSASCCRWRCRAWMGTLDARELPRRAAGRDAHQLHDRLHPGGRGVPHHGDGLHRHSARARRVDLRPSACSQLAAAGRADAVLHRARLLPRRHLDGGADHLDHHAAGREGRLRPRSGSASTSCSSSRWRRSPRRSASTCTSCRG